MTNRHAKEIVKNVIHKRASQVKESLDKAMTQKVGDVLTERKLELFSTLVTSKKK